MKRAAVIAAVFVLVGSVAAFRPSIRHYGDVTWWSGTESDPNIGHVVISSWNSASLGSDVDSALQHARNSVAGLILCLPPCSVSDSTLLVAIAGRFIPQTAGNIEPSGPWQWDKPLVVCYSDSTNCLLFSELRERRWTFAQLCESPNGDYEAEIELSKMISRYKRERVDRMEDMFRK